MSTYIDGTRTPWKLVHFHALLVCQYSLRSFGNENHYFHFAHSLDYITGYNITCTRSEMKICIFISLARLAIVYYTSIVSFKEKIFRMVLDKQH